MVLDDLAVDVEDERRERAKVLAEHLGGGRVEVRSAGSEPGDALNPAVVQVLHERGLSTDGESPKLLTYHGVQEADVVVTMGCGETCPVFPGKAYEDWPLDDPKGQDLDTVRRIVDEVEAVGAEVGATPAHIALAWLLAQGDDIAPISGTKRVARVEENTAADGVELSADQVERLNNLTPASGERHDEGNMAAIDR